MNLSEEQKSNIKRLKNLVDNPENVLISKLRPPKGVSSDVIEKVRAPEVDSRLYSYKDLADKINSMPEVEKIPTGINEIDELLDGGIQEGELMILTSPTKNGKTSLCQSMSFLQGKMDIPTLWFTLEMSWQELTRKFMLMDLAHQQGEPVSNIPIYYPTDNRSLSLGWMEKQIVKAQRENGVKMIYIDHLHFLVPLADSRSNISFMIGGIVRELKQMAVRLKIPILLIAHTKKLEVNAMPDLNSLRDCLPADQLVYVNGSRVAVEKIKKGNGVISYKSIKNLQKDKIVDVWKTGKKKIFRLTTKTNREIECSDGHKFYALTHNKVNKFGANQGCGIAGWIPLRDLRIGQKIAIVKNYPNTKKKDISTDQAKLLGWIIGDGHIAKGYYSEITAATMGEAEYIKLLAFNSFGINAVIVPYKNKKAFRVYLTNKGGKNNLVTFLKKIKFNPIGKNKYVPEFIFTQSKKVIGSFLSGLFQADGSVNKISNREVVISLSTISEQLAKDVQSLLVRLGIICFRRSQKTSNSGFKSSVEKIWMVNIYGQGVVSFGKLIKFCCGKEERFKKMLEGWKPKEKKRKYDIYFDRIKAIEFVGEKETWDISVRGHHNSLKNNSFCVNDFITHNSSFIAQESDFAIVMWRERIKFNKKADILENENVYTGRTLVSLEANRRNGKNRRFALGLMDGIFCSYNEYRREMMDREGKTLVNNMKNNDEELVNVKKKISERQLDL